MHEEDAAFKRVEEFLRARRATEIGAVVDTIYWNGGRFSLDEEDLDHVLELAWRYLDAG